MPAYYFIKKKEKYLAYKEYEEDAGFIDEYSTEEIVMGFYWTSDYEKAKKFLSIADAETFLVRKKGEFWQNVEIDYK